MKIHGYELPERIFEALKVSFRGRVVLPRIADTLAELSGFKGSFEELITTNYAGRHVLFGLATCSRPEHKGEVRVIFSADPKRQEGFKPIIAGHRSGAVAPVQFGSEAERAQAIRILREHRRLGADSEFHFPVDNIFPLVALVASAAVS